MKRLIRLMVCLVFVIINSVALKAQQKHFMYVQSADRQPFAIVMNGKVFSSSDYGYIIIPKLADSTYNFTVSFPMNKFPDQAFNYAVNKKDAGFILKSSSAGWALENMQTQKELLSSTAKANQNSNSFGNMLSDVVNDSNLTANSAATNNTRIADSIRTADSIAALSTQAIATNTPARLEKIAETKLDTGTNMLFVDKTQNGIDTINVFIPSEKVSTAAAIPSPIQNNAANASIKDTSATVENNNTVTENKAEDSVNDNSLNNAAEANQKKEELSNPFYKAEQNNAAASAQTNPVTTVIVSNSVKADCINMISDDDLTKLKRKMFGYNNDNDMIQYAIKFLNRKCLTTDQVKSIGTLFTSDDGRYSVYDALYKYVYDYGNYPDLSSQILDPYYKKRFAAMLR